MAQLYFKFGAMGSSKTANALMARFNYEERGQETLLVKPRLDTRDGDHMVYSRIGLKHPCIYFDEMREMSETELQTYACIIIDEAQFLTKDRSITSSTSSMTAASPSSATVSAPISRAICSPAATICWCWRTSWRRSKLSVGAAKKRPLTPVSTKMAMW